MTKFHPVAGELAFMQGIMHWIECSDETAEREHGGNRVTAYRR
jgi:hypothetical protein